ncbi:MAG TPA: class I SAM-dependent methyltransferase [Bacteroidota bacterium]|nr:class I SAM-dependent methyltransferase [Bacteroidota bacterium]
MEIFYGIEQVPVHSVLLMETREQALTYHRGDIALGFCPACGFMSNVVFDPSVHEYSSKYEETQGFSETFQSFHRGLAQRLIDRYDLHGKSLIEIGCGKGEFLTMLCEMGGNTGVGFDPAYISERNTSPARDRMTFIKDLYSEKYTSYHGDFVCCKMTLEHIHNVAEFMSTVRRSIGDRRETIVFFQIPDMKRILEEDAFWDIYYEHCSYFTQGSLARLFRRTGFDVVDLGTEYDGQYLMIEARPGTGTGTPALAQENDLQATTEAVRKFSASIDRTISLWRKRLTAYEKENKRVVIWGGGSKGVAFLTKLNVRDQIQYAVDINPYKKGTFMAGTGQEIVLPGFLTTYKPDVVIVMNPIYLGEIGQDLKRLGLAPQVIPIVEDEQLPGGNA